MSELAERVAGFVLGVLIGFHMGLIIVFIFLILYMGILS